ncbi:hypothetical protein LguiA_004170 [Lonicera macranthoides]
MYRPYKQWMPSYGCVYKNGVGKDTHFEIFKQNMEHIELFNRVTNKPYKLAVNEFADLTNDEFKAAGEKKARVVLGILGCAATDGITRLKKGKLISLSKQELDCDTSGVDGICNANKAVNHAAKITGHEDVPANSESELLKAVANQPISVAIDAGDSFSFTRAVSFLERVELS